MNPSEKLTELEDRIYFLKEQNKLLNEKIEVLQKKNQRLQGDIEAANQQNINLHGQYAMAEHKIEALQQQANRADGRMEAMQTQLNNVNRIARYLYQLSKEQQPQDRASSSREGAPLAAPPPPSARNRRGHERLSSSGPAPLQPWRPDTVQPKPAPALARQKPGSPKPKRKTVAETKPARQEPPKEKRVSLTRAQELAIGRCRQDYNALARLSGFDARKDREAFFRDYGVIPIFCANDSDRMAAPDTPPDFCTTDASKAHAWAVPLGGSLYAVFPRSRIIYDSTLHTADAMGDLFDSNYDAGAYEHIDVIHPAIFQNVSGKWTPAQRGKLQLH